MNRLLSKAVGSLSLDLFTTWLDPDKPQITLKILFLEKEMRAEVLSNTNYSLIPHYIPFIAENWEKPLKIRKKHCLDKLAKLSIIIKKINQRKLLREGESRKLLAKKVGFWNLDFWKKVTLSTKGKVFIYYINICPFKKGNQVLFWALLFARQKR